MTMSESVSSASSSKVSQFGLYRTIDSRTEEFLKLSKKRQIRQGCACAVVTTAVTVTVVVVILLVYEYAIAVESNIVQIGGNLMRQLNDSVVLNDTPVADRLDRGYLGFDQDYFEQMPLLVNAMQENSYSDPSLESLLPSIKHTRDPKSYNLTTEPVVKIGYKPTVLGKTSPRPFIFEYRSPTPVPFHKNYNSRSWLESYRNAQRLKNLEQVINYLEKTIHAKFGDVHNLPSSKHSIAFTGVLQPADHSSYHVKQIPESDLITQSSNNVQNVKKDHRENHQADPYFNFKPDSPGDVNLLADVPYKFSLANMPSFATKPSFRYPLFRPVTRLKGCVGPKCVSQIIEKKIFHSAEKSSEVRSSETGLFDTSNHKSFNVIMSLYPVTTHPTIQYTKKDTPDKIYITTSRPQFQLRRKSIYSPNRRRVYVRRHKRPRLLSDSSEENISSSHSSENLSSEVSGSTNEAKVTLHLDVVPKIESTTDLPTTSTEKFTPSAEIAYNPAYVSTCSPICSVEDYHVGSSGVIPIEMRTYPTNYVPQVTNAPPVFNSASTTEELRQWTTPQPEILKFSKEDARVPENYMQYQTTSQPEHSVDLQTEANRRNFRSFEEDDDNDDDEDRKRIDQDDDAKRQMLIVKLRNYLDDNTSISTAKNDKTPKDADENDTEDNIMDETTTEFINTESTTLDTYVPQINGHYRSVNQNSKQVNTWFDENSEEDRKARLEVISVTTQKKPALKYVEIKRHKNAEHNE